MTSVVLRDYQTRAVESAIAVLDRNPILAMPTGSGKTVTGVALCNRVAARTLWVAHRRELIHQAAQAIEDAGGRPGLILSGERPDPSAPFQVASVQTLARRSLPEADLLVIDEAHHAAAKSYAPLTAKYPRRVGLTATPFRLDGKGLASAGFGEIVVGAYTDELCAAGILHAPTVYALPGPALDGVRKTAGDYNSSDLESVATKDPRLVGNVIETWRKRANGKRTVVFAVGVDHARLLAQRFTAANVSCEVVTGKTPREERAATLQRLRLGATTVVVNCMVLTEGWDLPALEVACMARPTASLNLHLQMIGRIMRASEGKDGCLLLDHAGNYSRHGLVTDRVGYSLHDRAKKKPSDGATTLACPNCGKVIQRTENPCQSCGHRRVGTDRDMTPEETTDELLPIGHADPFSARADHYRRMFIKAQRIAAYRSGSLIDEDDTKAEAIAASMFHQRYGTWPCALGARLIDPAVAHETDWLSLRLRWERIGRSKSWDDDKIMWFVRKCETEARAASRR